MTEINERYVRNLAKFCRSARARSAEHAVAMSALERLPVPAAKMAILRQELDSMVRAIYLDEADQDNRRETLNTFADGAKWPKSDKAMVERANQLNGWTESVYCFGCAFIHLSSSHDYAEDDPMRTVSDEDRQSILCHMRKYHHGPSSDNPSFAEIATYFPAILKKISSNMECVLKKLERSAGLRDN